MATAKTTVRKRSTSTPKATAKRYPEGTYLVRTPSASFAGSRCGVGFVAGRGLATAEQARQLVEMYGYEAEIVSDADEAKDDADNADDGKTQPDES